MRVRVRGTPILTLNPTPTPTLAVNLALTLTPTPTLTLTLTLTRWELRGVRGVRCLLVRPYLIDTPLLAA